MSVLFLLNVCMSMPPLTRAVSLVCTYNRLREGRCAIASALASYKYMIMYGQVESINQVANAYLSITFTEWW